MNDLYEIQCEELNPAEYAHGLDAAPETEIRDFDEIRRDAGYTAFELVFAIGGVSAICLVFLFVFLIFKILWRFAFGC